MDKMKNAAIILLGLGEKCAAEILKNMNPKEVHSIIEAMSSIENISEQDVLKAMNDFYKETTSGGIDYASREHIKNSLLSVVSSKGMGNFLQGVDADKEKWFELLKTQPGSVIVDLLQDEHPQVITAVVMLIFNYSSSEKGSTLIKLLPKPLQNQVLKRMTNIGTVSRVAIDALATYFDQELESSEKLNAVSVDGLETVANIISYLDTNTEREILTELNNSDNSLGEKIQDKIFPFQRLTELDAKSLQVLLKEVKNEDLVLALKGVDDHIKNIFMNNMSTKAAELLKDEIDSKGPVKLSHVVDAQKKIVRIAKKLHEEEKIFLSSKNNNDIIY